MEIEAVKIHQMIPADGWLAVMDIDEEPYFVITRVIAWALVSRPESPDHSEICALGGELGLHLLDEDDIITYIHERDRRPEDAMSWSLVGKARYEPDNPEITPENGH
jgi:hypothetical protein